MMKTKSQTTTAAKSVQPASLPAEDPWEVRPGGMLVQKRELLSGGDSKNTTTVVPTIRVKVKHAGVYHEIYINSQATFGELKKLVSARTGLHPEDQKLMYKEKERDSKAFLDTVGVKDRSKIILVEDTEARARRLLEERRAGKMEKAAKTVTTISAEVDKLASKVSVLDAAVRKAEKVADNDLIQLTELLMNELLKLDAVVADGDVKVRRRMQVKRVQKYVEMLDAIKVKNTMIIQKQNEQMKQQPYQELQQQQQQQHKREFQPPAVTTTTAAQWEMFDLLSSLPSTSSAMSTSTVTSTASSGTAPKFDWELF